MTDTINQHDSQGEQHGLWENYWPDGTLWWKGHYHHGKLHGLSERYYKNGTIVWRYRFLYGKVHGLSENYSHGTPDNKRYYLNIK
jgi:antitoxin component YwqK of YwqJK toxin-antitoxin module